VPDAAGEPVSDADAGADSEAADGAADGGDEPAASPEATGAVVPLAAGDAAADGAADADGCELAVAAVLGVAAPGVTGGSDGGSVSTGPGVSSVSHVYLRPVAA
jgi:hypothetical protein